MGLVSMKVWRKGKNTFEPKPQTFLPGFPSPHFDADAQLVSPAIWVVPARAYGKC